MRPRNAELMAGLHAAIETVEAFERHGLDAPGGLVVVNATPMWASPIVGTVAKGPVLPFGPRTKGGRP